MPKLEYISFTGNLIQNLIPEFRYFIINELSKLRYYNWEPVTKEDRIVSADLKSKGIWNDNSKNNKIEKATKKIPIEKEKLMTQTTPMVRYETYTKSRLESLLEDPNNSFPKNDSNNESDMMNELDNILEMINQPFDQKEAEQENESEFIDSLDRILEKINISYEDQNDQQALTNEILIEENPKPSFLNSRKQALNKIMDDSSVQRLENNSGSKSFSNIKSLDEKLKLNSSSPNLLNRPLPQPLKSTNKQNEISFNSLKIENSIGGDEFWENFEGSLISDTISRSVIITIFKNNVAPEFLKNFQQQVIFIQKLQNPNIIPLKGYCLENKNILVWEHPKAISLSRHIKNLSNSYTSNNILIWIRQLINALVYLHSNNIIHGRLSPENIFIDNKDRISLLGHGFLDFQKEKINPNWQSPEILSSALYTEKTDIYSFSLILYFMFTRALPFQNHNIDSDYLFDEFSRPELPVEIFPIIISRLIQICWDSNYNLRPTAEKISRILQSNESDLLGPFITVLVKSLDTSRPNQRKSVPRIPRSSVPVELSPSYSQNKLKDSNQSQIENLNPKKNIRLPAASVNVNSFSVKPNISSPQPALHVVRPLAIKYVNTIDLTLENDQERKLVTVLGKLEEMIKSEEPESQIKAYNSILEINKDEKRSHYIATKSSITREIVESLNAQSVDEVSSWANIYPEAFKSIETALIVCCKLSSSDLMASIFVKYNIMEAIIRYLQYGPHSMKILAAQAITELCYIPEAQVAFRKAAGLNALIMMLKSNEDTLQVQSAWTLSSVLEDEINQEDFINSSGLKLLNDLIDNSNAALRLRSLAALSNFWPNEKAQETIIKSGLKSKLLPMLSAPTALLRSMAVRSLSKLIQFDSFEITEFESINIFKAIIQFVESPESLIRDRIHCIRILNSLAKDKISLQNFKDCGGIDLLLKFINDASVEIRILALNVLQRASSYENFRDSLISTNIISLLVSQIQSENLNIRIKIMQLILSLQTYPSVYKTLISCAIISRLCSIVCFAYNAQEQVISLQNLDVFSKNDPEGVREAGGLTAIIEGIQSYNLEAKYHACVNIGDLCKSERNLQAFYEQKGLLPYITSVLALLRLNQDQQKSQKPYNLDPKISLIINSALNVVFLMSKIGEYHQLLRNCDACQFSCDMLLLEDPQIEDQALQAILGISNDPRNIIIIRSSISVYLKTLSTSKNQENSKKAKHLLQLVAN